MTEAPSRYDAIVVGAGFGGLACALRLAEAGAKVLLVEALRYPGGCASTFTRGDDSFESGATLASGLGPHQLFAEWNERYELGLTFDLIDPVVEHRFDDQILPVWSNRERFLDEIARRSPNGDRVRGFFKRQARTAETLWRLFDDASLLPPFGAAAVSRHVASTPRYLSLLPLMGTPLEKLLRRHGLHDDPVLRPYLESVCQITVQASVAEAEAPFAMAAMDYYFRGTGHCHGGFGALADGLVRAIRLRGGEVRFASRARRVARDGDEWVVTLRQDVVRAPALAVNALPQALADLADADLHAEARLERLSRGVESGWGAAMLYRVVRPPDGAPSCAHHLDLTADTSEALIEGNHTFVSISAADDGRTTPGLRTMTVSTHIPADRVGNSGGVDPAGYYTSVHDRMRATLQALAPEWNDAVRELPASPRTFARFTRRPKGWVGGIPRRAGLHNYRELWPKPVWEGLWIVGDTVFPGQSALATAIGGVKTAEQMSAFAPSS